MAHTSRNSYEHALRRGKKSSLDAKPQACFDRVIPEQRSCLSLSQEPLLGIRFISHIISHLKHSPVLPPGSLNSLYSQWHVQRASGMACPVLGHVRQVVPSSGYTCRLLSWKLQLDHCWETRVQRSITLLFLAHNVQTPSYKPLHTGKIFPLRPRELFWDMWITHMSRGLQNGAQDLYKEATLRLLP